MTKTVTKRSRRIPQAGDLVRLHGGRVVQVGGAIANRMVGPDGRTAPWRFVVGTPGTDIRSEASETVGFDEIAEVLVD